MKIEMWPITRPIPYARNPRKIPQAAIDKVAASIKEFGFRQPIVCDEQDVILVGHTRQLGAQKLGLTEVPVHVAVGLTPAQAKAYRLADNRTNQEASWDIDLLPLEVAELKDLGLDLSLTGFEMGELDRMLLGADPAEDACPEVPEVAVSKLGDLWLCGPHRVLCGDATSEDCTSRACGAREGLPRAFLMATDPPYGVEYDPAWRDDCPDSAPSAQFSKKRARGKVQADDQVDWSPAFRLFCGDVAYVWHADRHAAEVATSLLACDFQARALIVWAKQHFVFGRGNYHCGHEPCWYAVRDGRSAHWRGDRTQSTLWQIQNLNPMGGNKNEKATGHGTQKPAELFRRPILNHTEKGEAIYDPFLGSGTALIAAELTERVCYGLEIEPRYVDVIVKRWQDLTKRRATLDGDGRTFEQVSEKRMGVAA